MDSAIEFTSKAAMKVAQMVAVKDLAKEPILRVYIQGGGCSGFQYGFELATEATDDDLVLERDGVKIYIDSVSLMYMEGSEIDFVDDLIGQSFQVNNPNAVAACGCGTSFSI